MFNDATIFLSIKPEYAEKILTGEKSIELRRTLPNIDSGDIILLYATAPLKQVIGYCSVERILRGRPHSLWHKVRKHCAVEKHQFDTYFRGASTAIGIEVSNPHRLECKLNLADLKTRSPDFRAPQSYRYVAFLEDKMRRYLEDAVSNAIPVPR